VTAEQRIELLRDAIAEILDITEGWTRRMDDTERVELIRRIAEEAWRTT